MSFPTPTQQKKRHVLTFQRVWVSSQRLCEFIRCGNTCFSEKEIAPYKMRVYSMVPKWFHSFTWWHQVSWEKVNVCTVVGHQNVHNCMITCDIYMINIWAIYMCLNSNSNLKIASHRRQMITWGRHSFGWVLHMVLYMLPFIFQWWSPFNNYTYIWQIVIPYFFHNLIAHKDLQFQNHFVFTMNEGQRSLGVEEPVRSS